MTSPTTPSFRRTRLREGYDIAEVDSFLDELRPWLAGRLPRPDVADRIRNARFAPVRLRLGYDMGDVDDHLAELERLASQGLPPA